MKNLIIESLGFLKIDKKKLNELVEIPKNSKMGDYAFPTFSLSKRLKKNPNEIAKGISEKIKIGEDFEKVEVAGGYVNFYLCKTKLVENVIMEIGNKGASYGSRKDGKGKKVIVEMSSPNIAKPFGIGHLRSTIIGNSIAKLSEFQGYKVTKINYLGDWGTQFGKLIFGYKKFGNAKKLKEDPVKHLLEIYVKANKKNYENYAKKWFKKLEDGDKEALKFWKSFREQSLKDFERVYEKIGVKFDVYSGESFYNEKMKKVMKDLKSKKLLEESDGALIVNLEKYNLEVSLMQKSDGATLYATRDLAAAIERYKKYKFSKMFYEVGSEQKLHFKQFFKILELMGNKWAKDCVHVDHGLYLDKDGKKFATRKGKTVFMEEIFDDIVLLAKKEIKKRSSKISAKELDERARKVAIAAIFYGDLKNYRSHDMVFDSKRFLSFEGDTGPYLLYSYARAQSILRKAKYNKSRRFKIEAVNEPEKRLVFDLGRFPEVVKHAYENLSPNLIANYAFKLAKNFNEFYHNSKVIGSDEEQYRLRLVDVFSQVIKNALGLLGIEVLDEM